MAASASASRKSKPADTPGSYMPPDKGMAWFKGVKRYFELAPRKLKPGAQTSFLTLVMADTQSGDVGGMTRELTVIGWARRCNVEERQMADAINDALDSGLVCSFPAVAKDQPRANRPKRLRFYMPSPEVWEAAPDVPKLGPKLVKAPVVEIDEAEEETAESRNLLRDSEPCQSFKIRPNALVSRKLPEPVEKLGYDNRTGHDLDIGLVRQTTGGFVLRIFATELQVPESRNLLRDSAQFSTDRKALKVEVNRLLPDVYRPDATIWAQIVRNLLDAPNSKFVAKLRTRVADGYRVRPGLLPEMALEVAAKWAETRDEELAAAERQAAAAAAEAAAVDHSDFAQWLKRKGLAWPEDTATFIALSDRFMEESEGGAS